MSFRSIFVALVIGFGLVLAGFLVNRQRPAYETDQASASMVRATGKCAECHANAAILHRARVRTERPRRQGRQLPGMPPAHRQSAPHATITASSSAKTLTAANCRSCHETEYQQFLRSRHAAPSWAAVYGEKGLSAEQVAFSEKFHPGACKRPPNPLVALEGTAAVGHAAASSATASASRTRTARSALARPATPGTPHRSRSPACRRPAASATWVPTTRNWRSTTSRSTASCSRPRRATSSWTPRPRS